MKVASRYYRDKAIDRPGRDGGYRTIFAEVIINSCAFNSREFLDMRNIEK